MSLVPFKTKPDSKTNVEKKIGVRDKIFFNCPLRSMKNFNKI